MKQINRNTKWLFLWLPRLHRLNVLWHTNVGHEIFHPALDRFFAEHRPTIARLITEACKASLNTQGLTTDESDLFDKSRVDMVVGETLNIWERGLSEILCDFGCARIFGPAAIMALSSMAQCDDLDARPESPDYYPPWRFRFRMVRDRIGKQVEESVAQQQTANPGLRGYFKAFSESLYGFNAIADAQDDEKQLHADRFCRIAYEQINATLNAGWQYVQSRVPSSVKRWDQTQEQIPALLARLEAGIPPSEVEVPGAQLCFQAADLSAIFVAGWVYESFWQRQKAEERKYDYLTFMRLILKGCEDAALRRAYEQRVAGDSVDEYDYRC